MDSAVPLNGQKIRFCSEIETWLTVGDGCKYFLDSRLGDFDILCKAMLVTIFVWVIYVVFSRFFFFYLTFVPSG